MRFAGGIWVLWNPNVVSMQPMATSFQEVHLDCQVSGKTSLFIAIYVNPIFERRKLLWTSFMNLALLLNLPWIILGDFNDIEKPFEKFGGRPPTLTRINFFNTFIDCCGLLDLGYIDPPFNWTNGRDNSPVIRTCIDRVHATSDWITLFPDSKVFHLPRPRSDHCPILLKTNNFHTQGVIPEILGY